MHSNLPGSSHLHQSVAPSPPPHPLQIEVKGSGFPILCLHGHPGSAQSLSVFTNHLSQRFQTIAPDLRGYGQSQTNQPFEMTDHLLDLEAVLNQQNLETCLLLGWSLGGILALELALKYPKRITGLILIASSAYPRGNHPPITGIDLVWTGVASVLNKLRPGWQWNIDTFGQRSLYRYLIQQHTTLAYQYLAQEGWNAFLQTSNWAHQALNRAIHRGYDRRQDLSQIQCPCLVLAGASDRHVTARSSVETAQLLPNCQWQVYPDTAHLFPWEIPQTVLARIDEWLVAHSQD